MTSTTEGHFDGKRPTFRHTYEGKFKDRNNDIRTAGVLTYGEGDTVEVCLRQPTISAPPDVLPTVQKYRTYTDPGLGKIRTHYGKHNDPKLYDLISHGIHTNDSDLRAGDLVNPMHDTNFESQRQELSENIYLTHKRAPLGKIPKGVLPKTIDPINHTFGIETHPEDNARDIVNPPKTRDEVELETSYKHEMYCLSHSDYEPGEQKNRRFLPPFNRNIRYGHTNHVFHDGRLAKESVNWLPQKLLDKRAQVESKVLDNFREKHTHQVGKQIDPNKDTRFVGPDHVYGLTNMTESFNAADIVHGRSIDRVLKGRERERAFVASLRSYLARYNNTKFKSLAAAFKFFDENKDGYVCKEELKKACEKAGYPIAEDLANALFYDCDYDNDGKLNFLEFSNFLCYKETMKTGLKYDPNDPEVVKAKENGVDYIIKDEDGRELLKASDLKPKNNIIGNDLVPRTLVNQIDKKVGTWKTTYDIYNEAPYRPEPIRKRVYGIPSIRNDLVAPEVKKIQDRKNYGDDGNGWSLLQPSVFTLRGINEKDFLLPRPKDEIRTIFKNIGVDLSDEIFESIWQRASSQNPYGEVSVEEFRTVLDEIKSISRQPLLVSN